MDQKTLTSTFKILEELGFHRWTEKSADYKENKNIPIGVLYDIRKWILEERNIFLEIELDLDLLYFWKAVNTKTGQEEDRTTDGFDSPELALENAIFKIVENGDNS